MIGERKPLLIWGAGGHGKVVADIARACGHGDICFLDDRAIAGGQVCGIQVFRPADLGGRFTGLSFLIAIGDNEVRARWFSLAKKWGWTPATLIHQSAVVSPSATVGFGTVVMPRVVVNASAVVGNNCILNTSSVVEHDCLIGDHVHISPSATLAGTVRVGSYTHIGMNACILPGMEVGTHAVIGAGAVVTKRVSDKTTVIGVPARPWHHPKQAIA
jgi:UDP-N-acetylbacillosamine N-acetyltransferase